LLQPSQNDRSFFSYDFKKLKINSPTIKFGRLRMVIPSYEGKVVSRSSSMVLRVA